MRITFISDTHTKHWELEGQLPGGDLLIHAGDIMNSGYVNYEMKIFVNGLPVKNSMIKKSLLLVIMTELLKISQIRLNLYWISFLILSI